MSRDVVGAQGNGALGSDPEGHRPPRAPYVRPTLTDLSVRETLGGTVPDFIESQTFTGDAGTVRGEDPS